MDKPDYNKPLQISAETAKALREAFDDARNEPLELVAEDNSQTIIFYEDENTLTVSWDSEKWKAFEVNQSGGFMTLKRRKEGRDE